MDKITQINSLYAEIFANREKINQIKGITKCENCGADVPLNATFCSVCGTKVVCKETVNERTGNERRCPACHAIAEDGSLFCKHCGTKIESVNE